jgi:hypothetical protein
VLRGKNGGGYPVIRPRLFLPGVAVAIATGLAGLGQTGEAAARTILLEHFTNYR